MTQTVNIFESNPHLAFCSECNRSIITDKYRGETVCEVCGLIHSEKEIDISKSNKNMFTPSEFKQRASHGPFQTNFSPGLDYSTFFEHNNSYSPNFKRIAKVDYWFKSDNHDAIRLAMKDFKRIYSNLSLPLAIASEGLYLYKKAHKLKLIQGRDSISFVCSCLYYSCRKHELPITINDIINECNAPIKRVKNAYKLLFKTFNLKIKPLTPQHFVSRYISDLGLNLDIEKKVLEVLQQLPYSFINGQNPKRILAGTIYFTCKKHELKTYQREIAHVCDVSEVSVRNTWKAIEKLIN